MIRKSCFVVLFLVASVSAGSAKTYLTGKLVHVDSEPSHIKTQVVSQGAQGADRAASDSEATTEIRTYVLYILYGDLTYSVRLIESPGYKLEWAVNDPIEFRLAKDAIYLRRPNGKEIKFPLLQPPKAEEPGPRETHASPVPPDLPFPTAQPQPVPTTRAVPAEPATPRVPHCAEIAAMGPQFESLANACEFALSPRNLPNFVCQETVKRANSKSQPVNWKDLDVVTAEVTFVNGRGDRYSNLAINGQPVNLPPEIHGGLALHRYLTQLHTGGSWSLAQFGTELAAIFNPRNRTSFKLDGEVNLPSGPSMVFDFHFNSENNYSFELDSGQIRFNPGLAGSLWIDQNSGKLLRGSLRHRA